MKKWVAAICVAAFLLSGCTEDTAPTEQKRADDPSATIELPRLGPPGETVAAIILGDIWAQYEPQERFSVYGGIPELPVADAPGDLKLEQSEKWANRCCYPIAHLDALEQGAALTHLLNETLFTAAVFRLSAVETVPAVLRDWRTEIQRSKWQTVTPERLLLAQVGGRYLVMALGSKAHICTFRQKLTQAYPTARVAYEEPITC